jgi:O-methyltransferase
MDYKAALGLANGLKGTLIELGFGKGNSLREFISYMNKGKIDKRNIWIYESFDGYREPTAEDVGKIKKGADKRPPQPAYDIVHTINREVNLVKGYIEETLPSNYSTEPVALIHSHLVSYTSTQHGLNVFKDKIEVGGLIVVTDYEVYPGTKQAVDEFVARNIAFTIIESNSKFTVIKRDKIQSFNNTSITRTRSILT